jgi:hypothetical protein
MLCSATPLFDLHHVSGCDSHSVVVEPAFDCKRSQWEPVWLLSQHSKMPQPSEGHHHVWNDDMALCHVPSETMVLPHGSWCLSALVDIVSVSVDSTACVIMPVSLLPGHHVGHIQKH